MQGLREVFGHRIIGTRLAGGRPVMGICVGMQILFDEGIEHGIQSRGCGEWPGRVERLQAEILPHMGWNTVEKQPGSEMFAGLSEDERFYFVHTYGVRDWTLVTDDLTTPPLVTWPSTRMTGSSPPWKTVRCGPRSSTRRNPGTRARSCCVTGSTTSNS